MENIDTEEDPLPESVPSTSKNSQFEANEHSDHEDSDRPHEAQVDSVPVNVRERNRKEKMTSTKKFVKSWLQDPAFSPWLRYHQESPGGDKMSCAICHKYEKGGVWATTGTDNFRYVGSSIVDLISFHILRSWGWYPGRGGPSLFTG